MGRLHSLITNTWIRQHCIRRALGQLALVSSFCLLSAGCQSSPAAIRRGITDTLNQQAASWNRGDINGYMAGYWQSPDLTFSGGGQTTRGWTATRDRYKAKYDTKEKMGTLTFSDLEIHPLSRDAAFVLGRWYLARRPEDARGNFSLVMRRLGSSWRVVHDHSSVEQPAASRPAQQSS